MPEEPNFPKECGQPGAGGAGLFGRSRGDLKRFLPEEARRVWELQQSDQLREIWFTEADRRAVLLLDCAAVEEGRTLPACIPWCNT